jgi:hypothetical protein
MTAGPPPAGSAAVDPVLARYTAELRPARARYLLIVLGVVALLVAGVATAWLTGEGRATTVVTATTPDPAVADAPLGTTLSVAWTSPDATAGGSTKTQGTIVTFGQHTVRGRSALTGQVRWSYTRTDVTVCDVVTQDGVAVAVFAKDGNCDEAVGLDVATGQRRWNRTLLDSGASTMTSRTGSALIVTGTSVHVLSPGFDPENVPSGGLDRWYWAPANCSVDAAQLGGRGVLSSLTCNGVPRLVLRKPYEDGEIWRIEDAAQPLLVTESAVIGWDASSSTLISFAPDTGARLATTPLPGCTDPVASDLATLTVVLCSGSTLHAFAAAAIGAPGLSEVWSEPAKALPVVQSTNEVAATQVVVLAPGSAGTIAARTVSAQTGAQLGGTAVALPAAAQTAVGTATRIERNGAGLLIAGTSTMMLSGAG